MNLQGKPIDGNKTIEHIVDNSASISCPPIKSVVEIDSPRVKFDEALDLDDPFSFEDNFDFNDDPVFNERVRTLLKRPPCFISSPSSRKSHYISFRTFAEFETKHTTTNSLQENVDLTGVTINLTDEHKLVRITMRFASNKTAYQQIKYYKRIINNIHRLKTDVTKVINVMKMNDIYEVPTITLADCYNDVFPRWADNVSHKIQACYQYDNIYIFVNYKMTKELKIRNTKHSLLHEFGHMIENRLYKNTYYSQNKYRKLVRNDFKLSLIKKTAQVLNYKPYTSFYSHVAPPTKFTNLQNSVHSLTASELFAESFSYYIRFNGKKIKRNPKRPISPILNEMFPNTHYIVGKIVNGKSINKYKVLKPKKITKMIKL